MKGILAKFMILALGLILGTALFGANALAEDISEMTVYANGNAVWHGLAGQSPQQLAVPALERNSDLTLRIVFKAGEDASNVKVRTWINGYRDEIEDRTGGFDIFKDMQYSKTLNLEIPEDIDAKDDYTLYVQIESKTDLSGVSEAKIDATVQRTSNKLKILDINLWSYKETVEGFEAGSTMYVDIILKNTGNHLAEDVFLKLSIPELAVTRTIYIGDIGSIDDQYEDAIKTTVGLSLPEEAEAGLYTLEVQAFNSDVEAEAIEPVSVFTTGVEGTDEGAEEAETEGNAVNWENVAMVISIILAVAIIVLLVILLVKQNPSAEELPEEAESYY